MAVILSVVVGWYRLKYAFFFLVKTVEDKTGRYVLISLKILICAFRQGKDKQEHDDIQLFKSFKEQRSDRDSWMFITMIYYQQP